ncbi:MAG: hypothetical protein R3Y27_04495, partial [Clostridia bacterium]
GVTFFCLPKKSNQKNGIFFFFWKKRKTKKAFKEVSLKILLKSVAFLGFGTGFLVCCFSFCFLVLCYRFCVCVLVDFSAVLGFVVVGNFRFVFCVIDFMLRSNISLCEA